MKLKHIFDYMSIEQFDDIEISDFSIITGLNGAGKTHFLNAICDGSIVIDGINESEIKYYNYNDFTIKSTDLLEKEKFKSEFINKASIIVGRINETKNKIISDLIKLETSILKLNLYNYWSGSRYNFEKFFGNPKDYEELDKIKEVVTDRISLEKYSNLFGSQFFSLLQNYLNSPGVSLKDLSYEKIKLINDEISNNLEEILQKYYSELYVFLKQNSNGTLFPTSTRDVEDTNFNIHEIEDLQKDFELKKYGTLFNAFQNEKCKDLNKQIFLNDLGITPIEKINEVLNEYDCNGYYLTTNNFEFPFGVDEDKINIPIRLINKSSGLVTDFNFLSSGEKTLIALTFLIYKSRRGKIIPRVLLLDEIDSSLHPSMIKRLLDVIQKIFVEKNKIKVILATHSPTTVALAPEDAIYVIHKYGNYKLTNESKSNALNILTEGFATLDQGLKLFDQISRKKICVFSEGNNINFLKKANEFFGSLDIEFMEGIEGVTGKNQLNSLFSLFAKFPHTSKVFFVWDCDVTNNLKSENNTFPYIFKKNSCSIDTKGIENLFQLNLFQPEFYDTRNIDYGGKTTTLNKKRFEEHMLLKGTKDDFELFKPLFEYINSN